MTPLDLLQFSAGARQIALWFHLLGLVVGAGIVLAFGWRRLTTPFRAEEVRRLQADLDEARRQAGEMFAQSQRMAEKYAEAKR